MLKRAMIVVTALAFCTPAYAVKPGGTPIGGVGNTGGGNSGGGIGNTGPGNPGQGPNPGAGNAGGTKPGGGGGGGNGGGKGGGKSQSAPRSGKSNAGLGLAMTICVMAAAANTMYSAHRVGTTQRRELTINEAARAASACPLFWPITFVMMQWKDNPATYQVAQGIWNYKQRNHVRCEFSDVGELTGQVENNACNRLGLAYGEAYNRGRVPAWFVNEMRR